MMPKNITKITCRIIFTGGTGGGASLHDYKIWYVDADNGDDANSGAFELPVKTVQAAIDLRELDASAYGEIKILSNIGGATAVLASNPAKTTAITGGSKLATFTSITATDTTLFLRQITASLLTINQTAANFMTVACYGCTVSDFVDVVATVGNAQVFLYQASALTISLAGAGENYDTKFTVTGGGALAINSGSTATFNEINLLSDSVLTVASTTPTIDKLNVEESFVTIGDTTILTVSTTFTHVNTVFRNYGNIDASGGTEDGKSGRFSDTKQAIGPTLAIPFNKLITKIDPLTITGATEFTVNETGAEYGNMTYQRVTPDGVNIPTFAAPFQKMLSSRAYVNDPETVNIIGCWFDGIAYLYSINQKEPLDRPEVVSMTVEDASPNDLVITLDESSTFTNVGGIFRVNTTPRTLSAVAGSPGAIQTFTISGAAILSTDTLDYAYDGPSGDVTGVALPNNKMSTFAVTPVTNSIAGPWTNLNGTSNYLDFGDILNAQVTPALSVVEMSFEARNQVLGGRYWAKSDPAADQSYFTAIAGGDQKITMNLYGSVTGDGDHQNSQSDAVVDFTNEHKFTFKKDGALHEMLIDDVQIASSVIATAGPYTGLLNNSVVKLTFGVDLNNAGTPSGFYIEGDFRNLLFVVNGTALINVPDLSTGIDISGNGNDGTFI